MKLFEFYKNREIAIMNVLWCQGYLISRYKDVKESEKRKEI